MEKGQQFGKDIAIEEKIQSENYQLNNSNPVQQFNSETARETAYNAVDQRETYHRTQYAYNENGQHEQYTEQAYNDYPSEEQQEKITYDYEQQKAEEKPIDNIDDFSRKYGLAKEFTYSAFEHSMEEHMSSGMFSKADNPLSGTYDKYNMTAEAPELSANTNNLLKNEEKIKRLDDKRKYVQRGYTRLTLKTNNKESSTKERLQFNYYGRVRLTENPVGLGHIGRLRYEGRVAREKMNRKDYEGQLRKKDNSAFKRKVTGRLIFSQGRSLISEDTLAEDENIASVKKTGINVARATAMTVRGNAKNLRLQNNVYARLEDAELKHQVLMDRRGRLLSDSKAKMQKQQLKEAQSREQKKKLKKRMVQQSAKEEGNFFQRMQHQAMVRTTARKYRQRVVKRTLSTVWSVCVLIMVIVIVLMFLILLILAATQGSTEYYAAAVTQNDYSTLTDATAYFRKLETDLDEYLNGDREALEAELEAEYGPDLYEYVYELADFGFSANTLIAYLSAVYGEFTLEDIQDELNEIFEEMYTLIIEVKVEDREVEKYNPSSGEYETVIEAKNICCVTLEKKELEEVVENRLPDDLNFQYSAYKLSTGGQQVYAPVMREDWTNRISSNYGERIHPITKVRTMHKGVDIAVPEGTKLYSAVKGTVTVSRYSESAGNYVTVQTDSGWSVTFMHMDSRAVSVGQVIEQGDFVGLSGNTGRSTGPHLHLQVENPEGNTVNPIFIIPQTCARKTEE